MGIMSSDVIEDVSFAGAIVVIDGNTIDDFIDDANPVDFQPCTIAEFQFSMNRKMFRIAKGAPLIMSVTVIPGSPSDTDLYHLWDTQRTESLRGEQEPAPFDASITLPQGRGKWNLFHGAALSGPAGPTVSGNGKMHGNTYTFAFEACS